MTSLKSSTDFRPTSKNQTRTNYSSKNDQQLDTSVRQHTERRFIEHQRRCEEVPVYRAIETVETRTEVPVKCIVNTQRPAVVTHEIQKEIERKVPLTEEKVLEIPSSVFSDKIVEVPMTVSVVKPVYKKEVRELIREVPKIVEKTIERTVDIPQIQYIDKFKEIPEIEYHLKYVPKKNFATRCPPQGPSVTIEVSSSENTTSSSSAASEYEDDDVPFISGEGNIPVDPRFQTTTAQPLCNQQGNYFVPPQSYVANHQPLATYGERQHVVGAQCSPSATTYLHPSQQPQQQLNYNVFPFSVPSCPPVNTFIPQNLNSPPHNVEMNFYSPHIIAGTPSQLQPGPTNLMSGYAQQLGSTITPTISYPTGAVMQQQQQCIQPQFFSPASITGISQEYFLPPPGVKLIDLDTPIPVPVPIYYDVPVDVPIERSVPTPYVVQQRVTPVYKESEHRQSVEVFVPKPHYVQSKLPEKLLPQKGNTRVLGYAPLTDTYPYPFPAGLTVGSNVKDPTFITGVPSLPATGLHTPHFSFVPMAASSNEPQFVPVAVQQQPSYNPYSISNHAQSLKAHQPNERNTTTVTFNPMYPHEHQQQQQQQSVTSTAPFPIPGWTSTTAKN